MSNDTQPEIRFPGFTDDWEQRKLGDFVVDYVEKTSVQNQFPMLTSSQQKGIVLQEDYFANRQVTTENNIGYFVLPRGYFTFRSRSDNDVFVFNRNDIIDRGIISYFYPVFTLKSADSDFFLRRINNGIQRQLSIQAEGTGQHVLSLKKFKNIVAMFPSEEEQQKIGTFFKQLDDTIALHQRKLDLLKETKKGFLQKMFPENGAKVPEIRFPGFTGDWEQRKLGELAESFEYGLNASAKKFDGSNKYIRITDIDDISHKFNQSGVTSPDIDFASADNYKLKKGDILFARTGASVGKTYMYRESDGLVYYAGFLIRARIKSKISSEFVFQTTFTDSYNRFIKITSQRSGQPGVNAEEYSNFKIMIPNYEEQNAIGCFFKKIDDTITLHQRKLDLLKETKKGFLQKMFV